jgi:hypothetical protein
LNFTTKTLASNHNYKITAHTNNIKQNNKWIITFGEIDSKLTETGFGSSFILKEGYNHIYVAQKYGTQYQFLARKTFCDIIKKEVKEGELFTYGSSLGAYCAIYYGSAINASILALSPRMPAHPVINKMTEESFKNKGFYHDDLSLCEKNYKKLYILYDKFNYIDNYYVNIFIKSAFPDAFYYHVENAGHYTARALLLSNELKNVVKAFFENKKISFTLNKEKILRWHFERTRKRIKQNKLFHARENLDVLLRTVDDHEFNLDKLINEYKAGLMSGKEKMKMTTTNIDSNRNEVYNKYNINTNKRAFSRYYKANLLNNIDEKYLDTVNSYWIKHYNKKIDPVLNLAFRNLTGKQDPRIIPSPVMWNEIIPYLNDMNIRIGYSDKNMYDRLINTPNAAKTILKRVRGHYYNSENNELSPEEAFEQMRSYENDLIIKPSDTDNGKGIQKIKYIDNQLYLDDKPIKLSDLEQEYKYNFIVQEVIKQHEIMAKPHPSSVNTLRMVTLRWDNKLHYLLSFARFGADNSVKDNAGTGGLCIGVNDNGEFLNFAIDEDCNIYEKHPTTGYDFNEYAKIPEFDKYKRFVIDLHKNMIHHDFVSWDIAVGVDNEPVFIEANFRGATWLYQMAAQKPLFGDLTEEILEHVSSELAIKVDKNVSSTASKKNKRLKREINQLKKSKSELKTEVSRLNKLKAENQRLKKELKAIKNSKSWKSTAFLRSLSKKIK